MFTLEINFRKYHELWFIIFLKAQNDFYKLQLRKFKIAAYSEKLFFELCLKVLVYKVLVSKIGIFKIVLLQIKS